MEATAKKRSLHQIESAILEVVDMAGEQEGELTAEQEGQLDLLGTEREQKLEASAAVILRLEEEAERHKKLAVRLAGQSEWLKGLVLNTMLKAGIEKAGDAYKLRVQKNPASCEIVDEKQVPCIFFRPPPPPPPPSIDKAAILKELKAGIPVAGARLADVRWHLRIR